MLLLAILLPGEFMLEKLILPDDLVVQIGGYARNCLPLEACGLVAGTETRCDRVPAGDQ